MHSWIMVAAFSIFTAYTPGKRPFRLLCICLFMITLVGCGRHPISRVKIPSTHDLGTGSEVSGSGTTPILVEIGIASWYGPPYHNRIAANGEKYDMNQLTAAHRTLPLDSVVRVTNLATSHSTVVSITDRGPFIAGRIIDLSLAAAKAIDVWQPGTARVRLEVLKAPVPLDEGGRWCVQVGEIRKKKDAYKLRDKIARRYRKASVSAFISPVGMWWIRIRVQDDDRQHAEELIRSTEIKEGNLFLVRID
jgi:rare lipoprotein A